jgi:hypothetical protein
LLHSWLRHHGMSLRISFRFHGSNVSTAKCFVAYYLIEFIDTYAFYFSTKELPSNPATRAP